MFDRHILAGAVLLIPLALGFVGCKPKVGDTCTTGQAACLDAKTALSCQDGKFIASPCKGPKGCKVEGSLQTCDISGNAAGNVCSKDDDGNTACTPDAKNQIACKGGKYIISPCRGPEGCKDKGNESVCDVSVAQVGEVCEDLTGGQHACSVDKKSVLECKAGKFAVAETCSGAKGCQIQGDKVGCAD